MGLYSRWPILERQILYFGLGELPAIYVRLNLNGEPVNFVVVHPPPPLGTEMYQERNRYLSEVKNFAQGLSGQAIVVGDLNTTMWEENHREFSQVGLRSARKGYGVLATWPSQFAAVGLPLDDCLITDGLRITSVKVGPNIGSDHLPLIVFMGIAMPFDSEVFKSHFPLFSQSENSELVYLNITLLLPSARR